MGRHRRHSKAKKSFQRAALGSAAVVAIATSSAPVAYAQPSDTSVEVTAPAPAPPAPAVEVAAPVVTIPGGDRVVSKAREYFGIGYVWGGEDRSGMDCSGLVWRVFQDLGVEVPRTSSAMADAGSAVGSLAEAQPGDLLLFDSDGDGVINHVGFYVAPGVMIDSANYGEVVQERNIWGDPVAIRRVAVDGEEVAPVAPETNQYTVVEGDWLSKIAPKVGTTWEELYQVNAATIGPNPDLIFPGQVFFVGGMPLANTPVEVPEASAAPQTFSEAIISNSAGPVSAAAQTAANAVFSNVLGAQLITIGGTRATARDMNGHPSGNALDYMVMSDSPLGDGIVQYHIDNWDALGVEYIIWQQRILTSPGGSWERMEDRGSVTQNHYDHVHVNYN